VSMMDESNREAEGPSHGPERTIRDADGSMGLRVLLAGDTIAGRLVRWFVAIALVPVLCVLVVTWRLTHQSVMTMQIGNLAALVEQKAARLHAHARERIQLVSGLGESPWVISALRDLPDATIAPKKKAQDVALLRALGANYGAPDVRLISAKGVVLFSSADPGAGGKSLESAELRESALARSLVRARRLMQAQVSNPQAGRPGERPAIFVTGPVIDGRTLVGFITIELSPHAIDEIVLDESGLGATGQTMCAADLGGELVLTTPTRFDPDAAFSVRVPLGSPRLARLQAAARGTGYEGTGADIEGESVIGAWMHVAPFRWGIGVTLRSEEAFALARHQQIAALSIAGLAILLAIVFAWFVARSISRPIARAAASSARLASGDLAQPITPIGRGEPRRLLESMRSAISTLGSLLGRVQGSAKELRQTAAEIRRTAEDQEEVAQSFGASATEVAAAVTEMTGTGRELAGTMSKVADAAQNAASAAGRGRTGLDELTPLQRVMNDATDGVARRLETIRERAAAINTVVTTINRVADQTNLLSINAALEAEKAGRYGLGFQVVAREINRLSEQTAEATTDIERIVAEMQEAVGEGVREMAGFSRVMEKGTATTEEIGVRFSEIIGLVEDLKERFGQVAESMDAQSIGTKQIAEAMVQLSDGARRTVGAVRSFVAASEQLERSAKALDEDVDRFKLPPS